MTVRETTRGRPLVALLFVLVCWVGARVLLWDAPALAPGRSTALPIAMPPPSAADEPIAEAEHGDLGEANLAASSYPPALLPAPPAFSVSPLPRSRPAGPLPVVSSHRRARRSLATVAPPLSFGTWPSDSTGIAVQLAAAYQMLWQATMQAPLPMGMAIPAPGRPDIPRDASESEPMVQRRWSGDGWVLLRRGGNVLPATGAAPSAYGASQAGGVLRYRLDPASAHDPRAYLRTTAALNGSNEREAALGVAARPLSDVPVIVAAEMRAAAQAGGTRLRPAIMAVTQLPPVALPHRLRGEAYAQAGYVAGRFATPFVDAQIRADRTVAAIGGTDVRAGAGIWGGAQKGASRLDIGPTAAMGVALGARASARLAVDWRFRVAGDAVPESGPALTLSAGF